MQTPKRTLALYNVQYYREDDTKRDRTEWKANILCKIDGPDVYAGILTFLVTFLKTKVEIYSVSQLAVLDAITDDAVDFIVAKSGFKV
jgi:hypothetical protein